MRSFVESRLALAELAIESCWTFEVPEVFASPDDLYTMLAWWKAEDEVPVLSEVRSALARIFERYGRPAGLAVRRGRFLWKAVVESQKAASRTHRTPNAAAGRPAPGE